MEITYTEEGKFISQQVADVSLSVGRAGGK